MKKLILLMLSIMMMAGIQSYAQGGDSKIQNAKVNLFTQRMGLTSKQAQQFWPKFNQYENEKRDLNRQIAQLKNDGSSTSNTLERLEMQKAQLIGKYKSSFLEVISADQLNKMYGAEEEFKRMLLNRLNGQ